ncbi:MAG: NAD(P) transhydrogenase subunit alpha part 2 [Planctomycetota bacterium]|jgi:NAD(P) transhydrogenase subunit alpha
MSGELLLFVFLLAALLGLELIRRVPAKLHTPLMSGSNAISGISLVGAIGSLGYASQSGSLIALALAGCAVGFAAINVFGGYVVTDRMLRKFKGPGS